MPMQILSQWWYDASFEDLMENLDEWLAENEGIQIVNMDWKFIQKPDSSKWYMVILYKPPG